MLNKASTLMKPQCLPCCRGCRYYHGGDQLVCAVHPYGPDSDTCHDFVAKINEVTPIVSAKIDLGEAGECFPKTPSLLGSLVLLYSMGIVVGLSGIIYTTISPPRPVFSPREPALSPRDNAARDNASGSPQQSIPSLGLEVR